MAHHPANEVPHRILMWRRVREYAVPPSMIETATARREVGDWAGACAAARIDVDLDLRSVRRRHGADLAALVRSDLRRLAPDLLRWHMPRVVPDGRLRPGLTLALARYRPSGSLTPHLVVRTPPARADAGQRMSLALWDGSDDDGRHPHPRPDRRFRLDLHRHLWDVDRGAELGRRCGADVPPFADPIASPALERSRFPSDGWAIGRWAAEAETLLRAEERPRGAFAVRLGTRRLGVFELVAPDDAHAPEVRPVDDPPPPQIVAALPLLPEAAARVLPDLELLRAGMFAPDRLHPIVAEGLGFDGSSPTPRVDAPSGGVHEVTCRGETHRIAVRDGVLVPLDHDPTPLRREELLMALGGPGLPCLRAIDAAHRDPESLPAVRDRILHGDFIGALDAVEALLGADAILRDGPLRDTLESAVSGRVEHGLFRAGMAPIGIESGATWLGDAPGTRRSATGAPVHRDRRTHESVRRGSTVRSRPRLAR